MANHYDDNESEREEARLDTPEQATQEPRAAGDKDKRSSRASGRSNRNEQGDATGGGKADGAAPKPPRSARKRERESRHEDDSGQTQTGGNILRLPVRATDGDADLAAEQAGDEDGVVHELEAQGFTPDEAIRLISVSDRMATSREAREAEAALRRLRFTRWLVERGVLDEFSA